MIIVQDLDTLEKHQFSLIDYHHHIGEDSDGSHKNLTVKGSLNFFRNIWQLIQEKYENLDSMKEIFQPKFKMVEIKPPRLLSQLSSSPFHQNSWVFDQFVAFPFHDSFRKQGQKQNGKIINYHSSNYRLSNMMNNTDIASRLIGWCRLDVHDDNKIFSELIDLITKHNMKGLKLHPLSDKWNEKQYFNHLDSIVVKILITASQLNIPVIFDCRYPSTLKWIYQATEIARNEMLDRGKSPEFVNSHLKVIVAHIGFLLNDEETLYKSMSHPNIYGDLTGQFSDKTKNLLDKLRKNIKYPDIRGGKNNIENYWSTKLVMGSDFNYLSDFHIAEQLLYLFSRDFYKRINGNLKILENIFSENIRRLLPKIPYQTNLGDNFQKDIKKSQNILNYAIKVPENKTLELISGLNNLIEKNGHGKYPGYLIIKSQIQNRNSSLQNIQFLKKNFKNSKTLMDHPLLYQMEWKDLPFYLEVEENVEENLDFVYLLDNFKQNIDINFKSIISFNDFKNLDEIQNYFSEILFPEEHGIEESNQSE